jgi:hypothetical protein
LLHHMFLQNPCRDPESRCVRGSEPASGQAVAAASARTQQLPRALITDKEQCPIRCLSRGWMAAHRQSEHPKCIRLQWALVP